MTALGAEGAKLLAAWLAAADAAARDPYGDTDDEAEWDAWSEWAALNDRCQQCGVDLRVADPDWPFAYCRPHGPDDLIREYDEATP